MFFGDNVYVPGVLLPMPVVTKKFACQPFDSIAFYRVTDPFTDSYSKTRLILVSRRINEYKMSVLNFFSVPGQLDEFGTF